MRFSILGKQEEIFTLQTIFYHAIPKNSSRTDLSLRSAAQSVSHRCMGKTCGFAAVLAAKAVTAAGPRGRNPISESTVKQSEK